MLDHTKPYVDRIHLNAELAGHAYKIDVDLQKLSGSGFSLFTGRMLAKPYHFGLNLPTTLCENKDGVHFVTSNLNAII